MALAVARISIDIVLAGLAFQFIWYAVPLLAVALFKKQVDAFDKGRTSPLGQLIIVAPCFNGAASLPGFMECMRAQDYPHERYKVIVIADNCTDASAQLALDLGADEVFERHNPAVRGKGYALDEFFQSRLQYESFDRLLLFDIDARVGSDYLRCAASCGCPEPSILQGSTVSKNPDESLFTRIGDLIQALLRLHQYGRSLLHLPPLLIGSHGICIDRQALARLQWCTAPKGPDGDDLELGLRSFLHGIPILYAPNLRVMNDLPVEGNAVRLQRRRWTRSVLRLAPAYATALVRRALTGDWKAWDVLVGVLLLPSFSNFFLILSGTAFALGAVSISWIAFRPQAAFSVGLWLCDILYLWSALQCAGASIRVGDIFRVPVYLGIRAIALVESFIHVRSKDWWPTAHPVKAGDE